MTDAEKNEVQAETAKILRFAGFTFYDFGVRGWMIENQVFEEPDTTDLTWLFKWCVPKIYGVKLSHRPNVMNGQWCAELFNRVSSGRIYRTTPGEALRAAILALIDAERVMGAPLGEGETDKPS